MPDSPDAEMSGAEMSGAEMSSAETAAPNRRRRNVPDPKLQYIKFLDKDWLNLPILDYVQAKVILSCILSIIIFYDTGIMNTLKMYS